MSRWSFSLFGSDGSKLSITGEKRREVTDRMAVERAQPPVATGLLPSQPWVGTLAGPGISQTTAKPTRDEVFAALLPKEERSYV